MRGNPAGPVRFGSICLDGVRNRNIGAMMRRWAEEAGSLFDAVSEVYIEAPLIPHHGGMDSVRPLWSLVALAEYLADAAGARCSEVATASHKKLIYGHGGRKPDNATEYAAAWGIPARNHDEADAVGVFLYGLQANHPREFDGWLRLRGKAGLVTRVETPRAAKRPRKRVGQADLF